MADEKREVDVRLNVDIGPAGDRAIKSLEEASKRAGEALGRAATPGPFKPTKPGTPVTSTPPAPPAAATPPKSAGDIYGFADTPDAKASKAALASSVKDLTDSAKKMADAAANPFRGIGGAHAGQAAAEAANNNLSILRNLQLGGIAGRVGTFQGYGQAATDLGFGGIGGALGKGALPLALAQSLGGAALTAGKIVADPYATTTQVGRNLLRSVVPGGSTALDIHDTLTGRAAEMEKARVGGQVQSINARSQAELIAFQSQFNVGQAGREARVAAFAGQRAIAPPSGARDTGEGERAFREESRLYPLRVQAAKAEREATAASRERLQADKEMNKLAADGKKLDSDRLSLTKKLNEEESGPARERILQQLKVQEEMIQANANAQRSAAGTRQEATNREAQARADVARNQAAQFGAQAENLEGRAATFAGSARRLGTMSAFERQQGLFALRAAQGNRLDALPPELRALALEFGGEDVGKKAEREGANVPELEEFKKLAPTTYGDAEGARQEAAGLRRKQAEKEFDADKFVATAAAGAGKDMAKATADVINTINESFKRELFNNLKIGRNAT